MAETTIEKKPWWVSEDERHGLENVPQHNLAENVVAGIPDLKKYEGGSVIAEYGIKDGLIVYHFYKKDRREVFLEAHRQMDAERDPSKNKEIARNANAALNTMPWWDDTEGKLREAFLETFKFSAHKINYYQEVDSWSVVLPEPQTPVPPNDDKLLEPIKRLVLRVTG